MVGKRTPTSSFRKERQERKTKKKHRERTSQRATRVLRRYSGVVLQHSKTRRWQKEEEKEEETQKGEKLCSIENFQKRKMQMAI